MHRLAGGSSVLTTMGQQRAVPVASARARRLSCYLDCQPLPGALAHIQPRIRLPFWSLARGLFASATNVGKPPLVVFAMAHNRSFQ